MGGVSIISGTLSSVSGTISDLNNPTIAIIYLLIIKIHPLFGFFNDRFVRFLYSRAM